MLKYIKFSHRGKHSEKWNWYLCDCGKLKQVRQSQVNNRTNPTRSCGCSRKKLKLGLKHGMSRKPVYRKWANMKNRCNNPKYRLYKDYGGRGISYSDKWHTFEGFWEDMGSSYKDGLTLERIDNDKNYCKENCTWIPAEKQNRNRRNVKLYEYKGQSLNLREICLMEGVSYGNLYRRVVKKKININQAIKELCRKN